MNALIRDLLVCSCWYAALVVAVLVVWSRVVPSSDDDPPRRPVVDMSRGRLVRHLTANQGR